MNNVVIAEKASGNGLSYNLVNKLSIISALLFLALPAVNMAQFWDVDRLLADTPTMFAFANIALFSGIGLQIVAFTENRLKGGTTFAFFGILVAAIIGGFVPSDVLQATIIKSCLGASAYLVSQFFMLSWLYKNAVRS